MSKVSEYIWFLKSKISVQKRQIEAYKNGNKYTSLRDDYEAVCRKLNQKIQKLENELAKSHSETITVRKYWSEIFDDLEKEHKLEIQSFKRAFSKMEARALKAEHEADVLKEKLAQERKEKYALGEQLEEANGKIQKLTAQVNKDFSNSSIPSSQQGAGRKKFQTAVKKPAGRAVDSPAMKAIV